MGNIIQVTLSDETDQPIAQIGLNGYRTLSTSPLHATQAQRLIWSFVILQDDNSEVKAAWATQRPLQLQTQNGKVATVRVAALPTSEHGVGLLEFDTRGHFAKSFACNQSL